MAKGLPKFYATKFGITKRGWREFRKDKKKTKAFRKKSSSKKKKNVKKNVRRVRSRTMAKKKGRRRNGFGIQSMFKWLRLGALLAPVASRVMTPASNANKIDWILQDYTGYSLAGKNFDIQRMKRGWLPFIMTNVITYGVGKINSMIRRL